MPLKKLGHLNAYNYLIKQLHSGILQRLSSSLSNNHDINQLETRY